MIFNRSKRLRIISSLVILLTMVAVPLVGVGDRPAQAAEPGQLAPMNAAFLEFWQNPPEGSGLVPDRLKGGCGALGKLWVCLVLP